jgi:hypothetical protein
MEELDGDPADRRALRTLEETVPGFSHVWGK